MTMQPHRLVEALADLADRCRTNDRFAALMQGQMASQMFRGVDTSEENRADQAATAYATMRSAIRAAYCYRVTADMTTLVQHAAQMLDSTDQFDPGLAPTGCGLAYFHGGLRVTGVRGETMVMHWLLWGPGRFARPDGGEETGMITWNFNDMILGPDKVAQDILERHGGVARRAFGRWGYMGMTANTPGERLGPATADPTAQQYLEIIASGDTPSPATNVTRLVHAFWLLLNQTITYSSPVVGMPPAVKGVAKKARVPGKVSVVELRRRVNLADRHDAREVHVEWSHRWIVRGFWRWQHYGPGGKSRKRIWIAPYIKGPEDKPLVATERVYDLKR